MTLVIKRLSAKVEKYVKRLEEIILKKKLLIVTMIGSMMLTGCSFSFSVGNDGSKKNTQEESLEAEEVEENNSIVLDSSSQNEVVSDAVVAEPESGTTNDVGGTINCTFGGTAFEFESPESLTLTEHDDIYGISGYNNMLHTTSLCTMGIGLEGATKESFAATSMGDWERFVQSYLQMTTISSSETLALKSGLPCVLFVGEMENYPGEIDMYLFLVEDEHLGCIWIANASTDVKAQADRYKQAIVNTLKVAVPQEVEPEKSFTIDERPSDAVAKENQSVAVDSSAKEYSVNDFNGNRYSFLLPGAFVNSNLYLSDNFVNGYDTNNDSITVRGYLDDNYESIVSGTNYTAYENHTYTVIDKAANVNGRKGYLIKDTYSDGSIEYDTYYFGTADKTLAVEYMPVKPSDDDLDRFLEYLCTIIQ